MKLRKGDILKLKILDAAKEIFLEKGFDGASISMIAKKVDIHQSLIYYHFTDKKDLWQKMKKHVFLQFDISSGTSGPSEINSSMSFHDFLEKIVLRRILLFKSNPEVQRLVLWQHLAAEGSELKNESVVSPISWVPYIEARQKAGEISNKYPATFYAHLLGSMAWNTFFMDDKSITEKHWKVFLADFEFYVKQDSAK